MQELEKVDIIRERMGIGYKEAKEALDRAGGDVVKALISLEEEKPQWSRKIQDRGQDIFQRIKELVRQGNVSKIRIKKGDRVLGELPVTAGVIGAALLPTLAALGVIACMVTQSTIEVIRPPREGEGEKVVEITLEEEEE